MSLRAGRPFYSGKANVHFASSIVSSLISSRQDHKTIIMEEMDTISDEGSDIEDADVYLSPRNTAKKTISFDSHLPTCSGTWSGDGDVEADEHDRSDPEASSTACTPPRKLRKAIRATRAQPQDVESYNTQRQSNHVRPRHILNIFLCNREDFTEINSEQVERVKTSK